MPPPQVRRWARRRTAHQGRRGPIGGGRRPLKLTQPPGPIVMVRGAAGRPAQRRPTAVAPATASAPTAIPAYTGPTAERTPPGVGLLLGVRASGPAAAACRSTSLSAG